MVTFQGEAPSENQGLHGGNLGRLGWQGIRKAHFVPRELISLRRTTFLGKAGRGGKVQDDRNDPYGKMKEQRG